MRVLKRYTQDGAGGGYLFRCPGCDEVHNVQTGEGPGTRWGFNGDLSAPTFTPSILVRSGHFVGNKTPGGCWCDYEERFGDKPRFACRVCHSFVTDGRIQFLDDCTHALAGQTVALPPWLEAEAIP